MWWLSVFIPFAVLWRKVSSLYIIELIIHILNSFSPILFCLMFHKSIDIFTYKLELTTRHTFTKNYIVHLRAIYHTVLFNSSLSLSLSELGSESSREINTNIIIVSKKMQNGNKQGNWVLINGLILKCSPNKSEHSIFI